MALTKIQWTSTIRGDGTSTPGYTFNPWRGCTKVSDGCKNCYADKLSKRNPKTLGVWGPNGTRVIASDAMWREPIKWDRLAKEAGERHRVFCASLADVFEGSETMPAEALPAVRAARLRLFELIRTTPNLDWLLLTKRPQNAMQIIQRSCEQTYDTNNDLCDWLIEWKNGNPPANVWLGTSVENQQTADERIPHLLRVPAAVHFLSAEPLLAKLELRSLIKGEDPNHGNCLFCGNTIGCECPGDGPMINWVIVGGESGPNARPCNVEWIRSIVQQCKAASVPVFVKQLGSKPEHPTGFRDSPDHSSVGRVLVRDRKGGEMSEWPADLRVREFPAKPN